MSASKVWEPVTNESEMAPPATNKTSGSDDPPRGSGLTSTTSGTTVSGQFFTTVIVP